MIMVKYLLWFHGRFTTVLSCTRFYVFMDLLTYLSVITGLTGETPHNLPSAIYWLLPFTVCVCDCTSARNGTRECSRDCISNRLKVCRHNKDTPLCLIAKHKENNNFTGEVHSSTPRAGNVVSHCIAFLFSCSFNKSLYLKKNLLCLCSVVK